MVFKMTIEKKVKISKLEFEEGMEEEIDNLSIDYKNVLDIFEKYKKDLKKYRIRYYKKGKSYIYGRSERDKIGFNN